MNELKRFEGYLQFKQEFDRTIHGQAEGFVRMGYLLKVAKDTDILSGSGYKSIAEFAWKEYGLREDTVSRMIAINDRYSVGGYSEELAERYRGFGPSLLAEMLTLPDEVADALPEGVTRAQIRDIKQEIREEEQISDMEILMEETDHRQKELDSDLVKVLYQYYRENSREYPRLSAAMAAGNITAETALDLLAPSGIAVKMVRIPGVGRFMLTVKSVNEDLELVNVRENEVKRYSWSECILALGELCRGTGDMDADWEACFGEPYPRNAPAQEKTEPKPESKPEPKPKPKPEPKPERKAEIKPEPKPEKKPEIRKEPELRMEPNRQEIVDEPENEPEEKPQDPVFETAYEILDRIRAALEGGEITLAKYRAGILLRCIEGLLTNEAEKPMEGQYELEDYLEEQEETWDD